MTITCIQLLVDFQIRSMYTLLLNSRLHKIIFYYANNGFNPQGNHIINPTVTTPELKQIICLPFKWDK